MYVLCYCGYDCEKCFTDANSQNKQTQKPSKKRICLAIKMITSFLLFHFLASKYQNIYNIFEVIFVHNAHKHTHTHRKIYYVNLITNNDIYFYSHFFLLDFLLAFESSFLLSLLCAFLFFWWCHQNMFCRMSRLCVCVCVYEYV